MKKYYTKPEFEKVSISATESVLSASPEDIENEWTTPDGDGDQYEG